jgi:hypothetical protein
MGVGLDGVVCHKVQQARAPSTQNHSVAVLSCLSEPSDPNSHLEIHLFLRAVLYGLSPLSRRNDMCHSNLGNTSCTSGLD